MVIEQVPRQFTGAQCALSQDFYGGREKWFLFDYDQTYARKPGDEFKSRFEI
jgi:hypothetical protein